MWDDGQAY
jgi:hypothetical protein